MVDLRKYVLMEWAAIRKAPLIFLTAILTAILVIAGVAYSAIDWRDSSIINNLKERLALRDDQISRLKDKVGTASPDEIKARIDQLESRLKTLSPGRFTEAQKAQLTVALKQSPGHIEIQQDVGAVGTRGFAHDFILAFQNAGWEVDATMVMGILNPPPHGVALRVSNPSAFTSHQNLVMDSLRAIGIEFDVQEAPLPRRRPGTELDAIIVVTERIL